MSARQRYHTAMKNLSLHEQRVARLFDYLREHYAHAPDVHRLAEEAHLSPWYLHRFYHQLMGETLHATVKWMRLHRAAWLLSNSDKSVATIARECGYQGNAQSFARLFRDAYGMTPHQYRQRPAPAFAVEVVQLAALPLAGLAHHGDYQRLGESYAKLEALLRLRGQMPDAPRVFALLYGDPVQIAEDDLRSFIAIAGDHADAPISTQTLPAGRYARLQHHGAAAEIDRVFCWFFTVWLPGTDWQADADTPAVIEFLSPLRDGDANAQRFQIYIPLRE
ncbi:MAG: AraC family transcriptional regulator [Cardiobacteriaceae bacterium]|nr:AraC family transcriptional regulator [Cardiobacteriaceae bacterium]